MFLQGSGRGTTVLPGASHRFEHYEHRHFNRLRVLWIVFYDSATGVLHVPAPVTRIMQVEQSKCIVMHVHLILDSLSFFSYLSLSLSLSCLSLFYSTGLIITRHCTIPSRMMQPRGIGNWLVP